VALLYAQIELHAFKKSGLRSTKSNKSKQLKVSGQLEENIITNLSFEKANQLRVFLQSDQARELFDKQRVSKKNSLRDSSRSIAKAAQDFGTTKPRFVDNKTFFIFRSENLWDCLFYTGISFPDTSINKIKTLKSIREQTLLPSVTYESVDSLYKPKQPFWIFPVIDNNLSFKVYPFNQNNNYFQNGENVGWIPEFIGDSHQHNKISSNNKVDVDFIKPNFLIPSKIYPNATLFAGFLSSQQWVKHIATKNLKNSSGDKVPNAMDLALFLGYKENSNYAKHLSLNASLKILGVKSTVNNEDLIYIDGLDSNSDLFDIHRYILTSGSWHLGELFQNYSKKYGDRCGSFYLIGPLHFNDQQLKLAQKATTSNNKKYFLQFANVFKEYYTTVEGRLFKSSQQEQEILKKLEAYIAGMLREMKQIIESKKYQKNIKSKKGKSDPVLKGLYLGQSITEAKQALDKLGIKSTIAYSKNMNLESLRSGLIQNYLLENDMNIGLSEDKLYIHTANKIFESLEVKPVGENTTYFPDVNSKMVLNVTFKEPNELWFLKPDFLNFFDKKSGIFFDENGRVNDIVLGPHALNKLFNVRPDMELSFIAEQFSKNVPGLNKLEPYFDTKSNVLFNNASIESGYKYESNAGFNFTLAEITKIGTGLFDGKGYYLQLKKVKTLDFE
jgi:hypothetical protein